MPKSRTTMVYNKIEMVRRTTFIYSSTCRKAEHVEQPEEGEFVIYDMLGNQLQKIKLFGNVQKATMDVSHLAKGMYTYKVSTSSYQSYTGKLIID
jgi:hypothetical protein